MEYPIDQKMSKNDFVQLLADKANMLKKHLKDTQSSLVMCANIGLNVAIFKLYNTLEEDSLKLWCTHNKLRRPRRTIVPIMGAAKLFNMGILSHCPTM